MTFERCIASRLGAPNDEVLHGHRLHGRGLEPYAAHVVERSAWVAEIQEINSVHAQYDPAHWTQVRHYLLTFHDSTFEALAIGVSIEELISSLPAALRECVRRVTESSGEDG